MKLQLFFAFGLRCSFAVSDDHLDARGWGSERENYLQFRWPSAEDQQRLPHTEKKLQCISFCDLCKYFRSAHIPSGELKSTIELVRWIWICLSKISAGSCESNFHRVDKSSSQSRHLSSSSGRRTQFSLHRKSTASEKITTARHRQRDHFYTMFVSATRIFLLPAQMRSKVEESSNFKLKTQKNKISRCSKSGLKRNQWHWLLAWVVRRRRRWRSLVVYFYF